jgi:hypothetical protein
VKVIDTININKICYIWDKFNKSLNLPGEQITPFVELSLFFVGTSLQKENFNLKEVLMEITKFVIMLSIGVASNVAEMRELHKKQEEYFNEVGTLLVVQSIPALFAATFILHF